MTTDSAEYRQKKAFFGKLLTLYGRKPVQEALHAKGTEVYRLHLSERNRPAAILDEIIELATNKGAEILYHSPEALSRISKNARQDQGVAIDLRCSHFQTLESFLANPQPSKIILALDRVTNPQNLGMIIRSVAASPAAAIIIPKKGCAPLSALVMKASAGALLKAPVIQVDNLQKALLRCQQNDFQIASLEGKSSESVSEYLAKNPTQTTVFVLGNETDGVSKEISNCCDLRLKIPMQRGVESLNVAVAASLIAFSGVTS